MAIPMDDVGVILGHGLGDTSGAIGTAGVKI